MTGRCKNIFRFKPFVLCHDLSGLKVNTDSVLLGAWTDAAEARRILDAGSGNGLLSLMMAYRYGRALVEGIEINARSHAESLRNLALNPGLALRIRLYHRPLEDWKPGRPYDLIISNPPYFDRPAPMADEARRQARHGGSSFIRALMQLAGQYLTPDGALYLIWPAGRRHLLLAYGYENGLFPARETMVADYPGAPAKRTLWKWTRRRQRPYRLETLYLHRPDGSPTDAYRRLTGNYYL